MSNPKISVIVPVYNAEKHLQQCVDSIIGQTYSDLELLLVDDGSQDASGVICDNYAAKDARVRVFHKKNAGVSSARNLGLDNAKGEWVCFIDSDDYVREKYFEDAIIYSSYDLITVSFQEFGAVNFLNGPKEKKEYKMPDDAFRLLDFSPNDRLKTPYLSSCVHLFKKKIVDEHQIRFIPSMRYGEDTLFVVTYLQYCSEIIQLPEVYYYYRIVNDAFQNKYKLSAEDTNVHCLVLTECFEKYCATYKCAMPQLYYSNYVTYLRAYVNYLTSETLFDNYKRSLMGLRVSYKHLRYAGRKLPVELFLMRLFPRIAFMLKKSC